MPRPGANDSGWLNRALVALAPDGRSNCAAAARLVLAP